MKLTLSDVRRWWHNDHDNSSDNHNSNHNHNLKDKDIDKDQQDRQDQGDQSANPLQEQQEDQEQGRKDSGSRAQWSSPIEFILSCLSFAVGLGNIWRFPYLCYRNGGGAFLIPYTINIFVTGIPLFFFELAFGQFSSKSPVTVWCVSPLFHGIGLSMLVISVCVGIYYNVIIAWAMYYLWATLTSLGEDSLPWVTCGNAWNSAACRQLGAPADNRTTAAKSAAEEYFSRNMLQLSPSIEHVGSLRWPLVLCLGLAWALVFVALLKGVKSVGKAVYVTAIFPYVILTLLLVRGVTLPGAAKGIEFYVTPQWDKLLHIQVWADAAIQIFFSLGPCWGALITLASYNKFHNNCFRDAIFVGMANCATSFYAGFVVFSFVGFMAHELDMDVSDVVASGPGLAFVVYPEAVSLLPAAHLWAALFFLMILALGFGTQFSILESIVTIVVDSFPARWPKPAHKKVLLCTCVLMLAGGLLLVTEGGMYLLQLLDNHAGTFSALANGLIELIVVAWLYGVDRFLGDIQTMFRWNTTTVFYRMFTQLWRLMWRFVTPLLIGLILTATLAQHRPSTYGNYVYPAWANGLGWAITAASVIWIPAVAIYKMAAAEGSFKERISSLVCPSLAWGPQLERHRESAEQVWAEQGYTTPADNQMKVLSGEACEQQDLLSTPGHNSKRDLPN